VIRDAFGLHSLRRMQVSAPARPRTTARPQTHASGFDVAIMTSVPPVALWSCFPGDLPCADHHASARRHTLGRRPSRPRATSLISRLRYRSSHAPTIGPRSNSRGRSNPGSIVEACRGYRCRGINRMNLRKTPTFTCSAESTKTSK
jgi:hypothetical protein